MMARILTTATLVAGAALLKGVADKAKGAIKEPLAR